jgi:hypothetical protein
MREQGILNSSSSKRVFHVTEVPPRRLSQPV